MLCSLGLSLQYGCYPDGAQYIDEFDITYTTFDEQYDFSGNSTYARPDRIVIDVEIDRFGDTTYIYMKDRFAQPLLAGIDENMQNYGWSKVDIEDNPDLLLMPAGISSTTYFYSWWYDWWYCPWYPGWGWYWPPYYQVSSVTTGSFIMALSDPNDGQESPINRSGISWLSVNNGILTGANDVTRALNGIDQSFIQSPYLKIN